MKNTKINSKTKKGLLIFVALFILLYVIIYVVPTVSDIFTITYIAEYGTLEAGHEVECVFVRSEESYLASSGGSISRNAQEGELLRAGSLVATVGNSNQYNNTRGIVSYYYDGYESKVTPDNMTEITSSFLKEYDASEGVKEAASGTAEAGSVIFKVIENSQWYLVFWLNEDKASSFTQDQSVTVDFGEGDSIPMTVYSITDQDGEYQIILSCNRNYDSFDKYRVKECNIIYSSSSGIILNTDSIVEKDGVKGVYVIDKFNNANFTPIRILSTQGDKTVVSKNYFYDTDGNSVHTVETYNEILKSGKNK